MTCDELREHVQSVVDTRGVAPVARELGVSRGGLTSFLAGASNPGTEALIRQNLSALATGGEAA